jgi:putative transposase
MDDWKIAEGSSALRRPSSPQIGINSHVLDILVQRRRKQHAAQQFFRTLLKGLTYLPRVIITDQLKSYGAAKRAMLPGVVHRQSRYLKNRCEYSHRPTR